MAVSSSTPLPSPDRDQADYFRSGEELSSSQAYGGPAHGQYWCLPTTSWPPEEIMLEADGESWCYRLVHHPRTRRPVRDFRNNYLYMQVHPAAAGQNHTDLPRAANGVCTGQQEQ